MTRRRRLAPRLAAATVAGLVAALAAALAGGSAADVAAAAAAGAVVVAGLLLAPGSWSGAVWPARERAERTSAGWHDVRLLADAMARAPRDPAVRSAVTDRIHGALGLPPLGGPASRRDLDRALASLTRPQAARPSRERP